MKKITKFIMLAASLSLAPNLTQAASSIGVDFTGDGPGANGWFLTPQDIAGVVPQANWNTISTVGGGDDVAVDRGTSGTLLNATGQATRVRLQYSGNDSWNTSGLTDTPNDKLMKGTLKHDASAGPLLLSFTNLDAGTYDVYVYGNVDGGPVDVDVSIGTVTNYWTEPAAYDEGTGFYEATSTDPAARMEGNYVKFASVSPVNGAITVYAFHRGGGNGVGVAAVQIVTAGTFPPFQGATAMGAQEQVASATVYTLTEASFRFVATNNAADPIPVTYQWYKNNQVMTNATGPQLTFLAGPNDNGANVYCVASMPEALNPNHLSLASATGTVAVLPGVTYTNGLKVEFFPGATRQNVEAGNVGPAFSISLISSFELPVNEGLYNYTRRVSGYFIPPTTGNYVFFVCGDDDSDLFISTNSDPANKRLIAQEDNWNASRNWVSIAGGSSSSASQKRSDQWSPDGGTTIPYLQGIPLVGGERYYMEGVQHQGLGGDNFAATYKLVSDADPLDGDAPKFEAGTHNIAFATSPATNLVWQIQPTNVTTAAGQSLTLVAKAATDSELAVVYQWYREGAPIQGATDASYSFMPVIADDNSNFSVTAALAQGGLSLTSPTITVKVNANDRAVLSFSDQVGNDVPADPNPYTEAQGLPAGLTATFEGFSNWRGSQDHTPTADNYLLYGDQYDPGSISRVTFNMPVEVPSFWTATSAGGGQVGVATLVGYLGNTEQFRLTLNNPGFEDITVGAGKLIDRIEFTDYGDSWIDDMTIVKPALLTFSDQIGNDVPANPGVYSEAQGLPAGVNAALQGFSNWKGSQDHTPSADNYLLYGNNYDPGSVSSITFSVPVIVPSLWVSTEGGGQSAKATIKGLLSGVEQFSYAITAGGFVELTAGAGKPIDTLRFIDYGDSWIDDMTVLKAPVLPPPMITFSDQVGNDVPADPSVYTDAQGLPTGITATFDGFSNWNGSQDHTPTGDNYLLYGNNYEGGVSTLTFNKPVEVPSFWVSAEGGGQAGAATIKAYLGAVEQFSYVLGAGGFAEVTAGAGKSIDSIRFIDYGDSWIDDIVIKAAAVSARLTIVKNANGTITLSWTGSGTLQQTSALPGGWATAPSQANPQTVPPSPGNMFYRLAIP